METSDSTQDTPRQPNDTRGGGTVTFAEFIEWNREGQMKSAAKEAKKESRALVFIEVTGVIVACIAIIASLAYPVVTAASWGG